MMDDYLKGLRERAREEEEEDRILKDFKQRKFEEYLKMTRAFRYSGLRARVSFSDYAKKYMWADEVAKRVSGKYNVEVKFEIDVESGFSTTFDSTGMDDKQLIDEIMMRVDIIVEAREMFLSKEMRNEFLKSGGIEVKK